jgi:hypothetical protein
MTVQARAVYSWFCLVCLLLAPALSSPAAAPYFGRNKVEYRDFDFRTLRTEHFDIYYYPREERAVPDAARMAERWYARLSGVLNHRFESRQPLILYGSHPEFSQTNVISQFLDESIGRVTESLRRRIVLPFAPGLAETDHVLGHEIVHAFQIDILKKQTRPMRMPLWFAEGMAEYLSVGPEDPLTATWIRDAAEHGKLPSIKKLNGRGVSPYRFGQALWAYLAGRFGDNFIERVLHSTEKGDAVTRIARVAGVDHEVLSEEWRLAVLRDFAPVSDALRTKTDLQPLIGGRSTNRLNIAPALSPDGRELIFLSEKDQFSIDLFVADATTGVVSRKLLTRTADQHLESLQFVNSAGADPPAAVSHVGGRAKRAVLSSSMSEPGSAKWSSVAGSRRNLPPTWSLTASQSPSPSGGRSHRSLLQLENTVASTSGDGLRISSRVVARRTSSGFRHRSIFQSPPSLRFGPPARPLRRPEVDTEGRGVRRAAHRSTGVVTARACSLFRSRPASATSFGWILRRVGPPGHGCRNRRDGADVLEPCAVGGTIRRQDRIQRASERQVPNRCARLCGDSCRPAGCCPFFCQRRIVASTRPGGWGRRRTERSGVRSSSRDRADRRAIHVHDVTGRIRAAVSQLWRQPARHVRARRNVVSLR